jgi:hypothetical protein
MKPLGIFALLLAAACAPTTEAHLPPNNAFYFPSGIVYQEFGAPKEGYLYVASANYDKRFDSGSLSVVRLSSVSGLPPIGAGVSPSGPVQLQNLGSDFSQVFIDSFAGEMAAYIPQDASGNPRHDCVDAGGSPLPDCPIRLFIPTRSEGDLLQIVDASGTSMTCLHGGTNCVDPSLSLTALERVGNGKPRAPEPIGVAVSSAGSGDVFVTHLKPADSPPKSNLLLETYVVHLSATDPVIDEMSFLSLNTQCALNGCPITSSVALGSRYAYLSSRYITSAGTMIFSLDQRNLTPNNPTVYDSFLQVSYQTLESRGVAIGSNERRLYVAGRSPESLVVVNIANPTADVPVLTVARTLTVPDGPNEVRVIPRQQRGDLVVVTSSTAGVVSIYDDDVGRLVSQITGVGSEPFGLTVQAGVNQARIFVSNFGDGRIAVIDIADLNHPERAQLVAHLGKAQTCLLEENDASCVTATSP